MTNDQRKKLDEAKRLLAELEQEMGASVETTLADCKQYGVHPNALMFASMELGQVMAAKKALEGAVKAPTLRELRVEAGRRGLGTTVRCDRLHWGWEYTIRSPDGSIPVRCRAPTKTGARTGMMAALRTVPRTKDGQLRRCISLIKGRGAW